MRPELFSNVFVCHLHNLHGMSRFFGDMSTFGMMTLC